MSVLIEEILPRFYRAEIPLPQNPLKATNSYIIKGEDRSLVIDTGMNRKECMDAMTAAFQELGIIPDLTDFFITHVHADHLGLAGELSAPSSKIHLSAPDAAVTEMENIWGYLAMMALQHGFPQGDTAVDRHPGNRYSPGEHLSFSIVREGDRIACGKYIFDCIATPGHTPGHMCLYEPHRKIFVSGDHILGDITPNISSWDDVTNPLQQYLASLDKVFEMELDMVLPGHRSRISDCRQRIRELKEHHRTRLEEALQILRSGGPATAYRVASQMTWDILADDWEMFPLMQKWFATGEALAHLRYLEDRGSVRREDSAGVVHFIPAF